MTLGGGKCAGCGSAVAADQRYCLQCGSPIGARKVGTMPLAQGQRPSTPAIATVPLNTAGVPTTRSTALLAAAVLGFGVFVGSTITPGVPGGLAGGRYLINLPGGGGGDGAAAGGALAGGGLGDVVANKTVGGGGVAGGGVSAPVGPAPSGPVGAAPSAPIEEPPVEAQSLAGTVVQDNPGAKSYSIATSDGELFAIHTATSKLPKPGQSIKVNVDRLFNATYGESGKRKASGTKKNATFTATVTFVDSDARVYTVSARGVSALVHAPAAGDGVPALPKVGDVVKAKVSIADPPADDGSDPPAGVYEFKPTATLHQLDLTVDEQATDPVDLEGVVQSVDDSKHELVISADDLRECGKDITLTVPDTIKISDLKPGQTVDVTVQVNSDDGSLAPTGMSIDDSAKTANDSDTGQGDQSFG